jgi:hypothetical protein
VDGATLEIKVVVDSQNQIFFIAEDSSNVLGGFGSITVAAPKTQALGADKHGDDDPPGDDHGQDADDLSD